MKEAFKIGGYAWHAHKRFEAVKDGWSFEKTVEWLGSMGMDFCRSSIGRLVNFYSTYVCDREVLATSLRDSYTLVNQQADEVVGLPSRMKIIERIFTALPSDDSTNPKELIRELIRAAKVFAVTERTIQRWKPETLKQKRLSNEEVQKIQELREEGKSQREIAEKVGVHEATVSRNLQNDKCQSASSDSTPSYLEPSNVIPSPVSFQKQEPVDDYDDEDDEDLDIETLDDEKLLVDPEWQLWSDNQIAKQCAVDHKTVAKIRNDLQKSDLGFPKIQERNFERNGKTHTMDTAKR